MSLSKVLETARGELGYTESPPGSNRTKYWEAYDPAWQGQPWCAAFLWWCFREAGEGSAFFGGAKTASCGMLYRWYREQGQTVPAEEVRAGDILLLNFRGGTEPEHCGLVEDTPVQNGRTVIYTVEGNTATGYEGSQNNGGCVALRIRYPSQIVGVCRPQYKDEPMPKDYEGRWSEQAMRWAIDAGIMEGYPDGTFRPEKPVTREELAVMLQRYNAAKEKGDLK
jgi:hypothetical protein